jgi:hypothetical protein
MNYHWKDAWIHISVDVETPHTAESWTPFFVQKCFILEGFRARDTLIKHRPNKIRSHCIRVAVNYECLTEIGLKPKITPKDHKAHNQEHFCYMFMSDLLIASSLAAIYVCLFFHLNTRSVQQSSFLIMSKSSITQSS